MLAVIVIASQRPCLLYYLLRTSGSFWLESYTANWNLHISSFRDLSKVRQLVNLTRTEVWFLDQSVPCSTLPLPPTMVNREEDVSTAPGHQWPESLPALPKDHLCMKGARLMSPATASQPQCAPQNKSEGFAPLQTDFNMWPLWDTYTHTHTHTHIYHIYIYVYENSHFCSVHIYMYTTYIYISIYTVYIYVQ